MDELREKTGLDKSKLNKRMAFWCSRGILKQGPLENATSETWALSDSTADFERFSKQVQRLVFTNETYAFRFSNCKQMWKRTSATTKKKKKCPLTFK